VASSFETRFALLRMRSIAARDRVKKTTRHLAAAAAGMAERFTLAVTQIGKWSVIA
jgi:hypothetical protein